MNYETIIGSTIDLDGEKIKITDSCRTCKRLWGETSHERFYIKVDRWENKKIIERKIKTLE